MGKIPRISEAEWLVMKVLWERSPLLASQVIEALEPQTKWSPRTIKTLLGRLVRKGALGFDKVERSYAYYPKVDERACVKEESQSFLHRVYDGMLTAMMATFLEDRKLSRTEIEELKRLLEQEEKRK